MLLKINELDSLWEYDPSWEYITHSQSILTYFASWHISKLWAFRTCGIHFLSWGLTGNTNIAQGSGRELNNKNQNCDTEGFACLLPRLSFLQLTLLLVCNSVPSRNICMLKKFVCIRLCSSICLTGLLLINWKYSGRLGL